MLRHAATAASCPGINSCVQLRSLSGRAFGSVCIAHQQLLSVWSRLQQSQQKHEQKIEQASSTTGSPSTLAAAAASPLACIRPVGVDMAG